MNDYMKKAAEIRGRLVELSNQTATPHLGGCLSCVDVMVALYYLIMNVKPDNFDSPDRDRFFLGKGHTVNTLYIILADLGFFSEDLLISIGKIGCPLEEHPSYKSVNGIESMAGSLGHALPIAVGDSIAARIKGLNYKSFILLGDGELNEGTNWEAAMFAAKHKLDKLTVIIDFNKWQATGRSCDVMLLEPLKDKWESFGWSVYEIDGHDIKKIIEILKNVPDGSGKPVAIIAHTVKGKGVSFIEDDNNWHYRIPTQEEIIKAKIELGLSV